MENRKKTTASIYRVINVLVCLLGIVTISFLVECLVFQFPALKYKSQPITFRGDDSALSYAVEDALVELSEEEQKSIEVDRNNQKILAEYYGTEYEETEDETLVEKDGSMFRKAYRNKLSIKLKEPMYIHKLDFRAKTTKTAGYSVDLYLGDVKIDRDIYCSIEPKIGAGIANISERADGLEIELMTQEELEPSDIQITLSNKFAPNRMRIFFMMVLLAIVAILSQARELLSTKPEWIFVVVALALGSLLICGTGTNQVSYDEHVHAKASYKLSFGTTIESTESVLQMVGNNLPYFNNPEERALMEAYEQKNHDYSWADIGHQSRFVRTETKVYYPMAAGFFLARKLHLSFALSVIFAKFGNLLFYIFVVFWAIKLAKKYKELVALIGLLPNCIFLASHLSYDSIVNSFLLLGFVALANEVLTPLERLKWYNLLLILLSFFVGCQSKPIYIVMVLLILFFGKDKFVGRPQEIVCKLAVLVMAGLMLYNIFFPTPAAASDYILVGDFSLSGDKRNVGTSVTGQLQFILQNPLAYTGILLKNMFDMPYRYLTGKAGFLQYGYLGSASTIFTYLLIVLAVYLALFSPKAQTRKGLMPRFIILHLIMVFGTCAIVWSSMYVSYTTVGSEIIRGVQGRYFIPVFLPTLLCLLNEKHQDKLGTLGRARILYGAMAGLNLYMIYTLVITVMNI